MGESSALKIPSRIKKDAPEAEKFTPKHLK